MVFLFILTVASYNTAGSAENISNPYGFITGQSCVQAMLQLLSQSVEVSLWVSEHHKHLELAGTVD